MNGGEGGMMTPPRPGGARARRCEGHPGAAGWTARRRRGGPPRAVAEGDEARLEAIRRSTA
jgi:hypothetical protein